jgi:L-ascorbate metabolism protein UlaG (beta-lactamase superfamily)
MLPVGGVSTVNASMAAEVVRKVEPKIVIPMHYKTEQTTRELDGVEPFLRELGRGDSEIRAKATITRSNLPAGMQVYLLSPQG